MKQTTCRTRAGVLVALGALWVWNSYAEDAFPPCWRGNPGTTHQDWSFTSSNNPAAPDVCNDTNNTPQAILNVGPFGVGWISSILGRTDAWDLGQSGNASLVIPDLPSPTGAKYVQVQVTCLEDGQLYLPPGVSLVGATLLSSHVASHESVGPATWKTHQTLWLLQPSSVSEPVLLAGSPNKGLVIERVIVDTTPVVADLPDVPTDAGHCYATGVDLGASASTDHCGSLTLSNDAPAQFPHGTTAVHWTVSEGSNTANFAQMVTVQDHEPPTIITCPPNRTLTGCHVTLPDLTSEVVATDNCSTSFTVSQEPPAGTSLTAQVTVVTLTVRDQDGNSTICNLNVQAAPASLGIVKSGATVTLTWAGGGTLLEADTLTGSWTPVVGATSPFTPAPPLAGRKFYRLQCD